MPFAFAAAFEALSGHPPFPWQARLFAELAAGTIPAALDMPTGLGKTSVMAVWLLARAAGADLPRRLVWVVDRRAIVDQASEEAARLAANLTKPELTTVLERLGPLGLSTLRGQHADNGDWRADPSACAIVVGTVDMTGSRLLFRGYGVSKGMRPFHAGLLGHDTLVVLDEAHLVPPFAALLARIAGAEGPGAHLGPRQGAPALPGQGLRFLPLSATLGAALPPGAVLRLDAEDRADAVVARRLAAPKRLERRPLPEGAALAEALAGAALALLPAEAPTPARVAVFCDSRKDVDAVADRLRKAANVITYTGERRGHERDLARDELAKAGFLHGAARPTEPAVLVATSAAEVGVDLDATDAVMDLVAWERMVQRLGRVNRRGEGAARVAVIDAGAETLPSGADPASVRGLIEALAGDASPAALRAAEEGNPGLRSRAATPAPLRPRLERAHVEAWAMTRLGDDPASHPGRPAVEPFLRGWTEEEEPEVTLAFRRHLPVAEDETKVTDADVAAYFAAAPVHVSERLAVPRYRALDWFGTRLKRLDAAALAAGKVALLLGHDGEVAEGWTRAALADLFAKTPAAKRRREGFERLILRGTLVLDARFGGLADGRLKDDEGAEAPSADDGKEPSWSELVGFTVEEVTAGAETGDEAAGELFRFVVKQNREGDPEKTLVVRPAGRAGEEKRERHSRWVTLAAHVGHVVAEAERLAGALGLAPEAQAALIAAAHWHDEGKQAARWQGRGSEKCGGPWGKLPFPPGGGGYRHEFGSLLLLAAPPADFAPSLAAGPDPRDLPQPWADLALHLIGSHHGHLRPGISASSADYGAPSANEAMALAAALRAARLQSLWGPWGLAYWEALLRAADQSASRAEDHGAGG